MRGILSTSPLFRHDSRSWPIQVHHTLFSLSTRKPDLLQPRVTAGNTASHRFLFSNFRYYFTFFSKFFSSFPHGTCSLSVSHQYLALDGIYHPLRAAIPNNSTRWKQNLDLRGRLTGLSPSLALRSRRLYPPRSVLSCFSRRHFRRFYVWAFPASLAVTEGILVSFFSSA